MFFIRIPVVRVNTRLSRLAPGLKMHVEDEG